MIRAFVVASLLALTAAPAVACSVDDSYRVPTNLELTEDAQLIILATIEDGPTEPDGLMQANMSIRPIATLKGNLPPGPIKLPGMIGTRGAFTMKSNPANLLSAHPLAGIGSCVRFIFPKGSTVLFFLKPFEGSEDVPAEMKGMLMPAGGPFARWAEDVASADSAWVKVTKLYVTAAALPKDERAAFLRAERNNLSRLGDADSKLIAEDIDRQLAGPNKPWNQLMDEEIKKMKERGEDPFGGLAKEE